MSAGSTELEPGPLFRIESDLAMTLVMTCLSTFGITRQNVQLGRALGKAV